VLGALLSGCQATPARHAEDGWRPDDRVLTQLESSIRLPPEAHPLPAYARYYAGTAEAGRRLVRGVLMLPIDRPASIYVVAPGALPETYDGGCGVIELEYDVASEVIVALACHGNA
jgi:hypothetical protein